jgi:hypothetical protein
VCVCVCVCVVVSDRFFVHLIEFSNGWDTLCAFRPHVLAGDLTGGLVTAVLLGGDQNACQVVVVSLDMTAVGVVIPH